MKTNKAQIYTAHKLEAAFPLVTLTPFSLWQLLLHAFFCDEFSKRTAELMESKNCGNNKQ
jgi:hypothetical protein